MKYNKNKTDVRKSDQVLEYYSFLMELMKWCKQIVFHVFDLAMVNTTHKTNRKKIALQLFYKEVNNTDIWGKKFKDSYGIFLPADKLQFNSLYQITTKIKGEQVLLLLPSVNSNPDQANSYTKRILKSTFMQQSIRRLVQLYQFSDQIQESPVVIHKQKCSS